MKETPLSTSEKTFVTECLKQKQRLDGRKLNEFRSMIISYGSDWGSVHVSLGNTRVLAQVSCELGQPTSTRPNEGLLFINVELGPMAACHFEAGRNSDLTVRINRILERTFKDSRCVDLESLCVTAEDRVWILRIDVNVLNHEGNIIDCASAAALCALAHFKRPDVSVEGDEIKIHTAAEKDFIPIVLHHYPVCISYATFLDGEVAIADPSYIEERVSDAEMIFGLNSYRELCCLNLSGKTLTSSKLLLDCAKKAASHAQGTVELIKYELQCDIDARAGNEAVGFSECLKLKKLNTVSEEQLSMKIRYFHFNMPYISRKKVEVKMEIDETAQDYQQNGIMKVEKIDPTTSSLSSNQKNVNWLPDNDSDENDGADDLSKDLGACMSGNEDYDDDDDDEEEDENLEHQVEDATEHMKNMRTNKPISKGTPAVKKESPETSSTDDSEEEETVVLG